MYPSYSSMVQQPYGGDLSSKLTPNPSVFYTPSFWSTLFARDLTKNLVAMRQIMALQVDQDLIASMLVDPNILDEHLYVESCLEDAFSDVNRVSNHVK